MITYIALITFCVAVAPADAAVEPRDNPIFAADARLELIYRRTARLNSGLTEGPAAAADGSIYFTDMPFGPDDQTIIHRYEPKTRKLSVFTAAAGKSNGLAFDGQGRLVACDGADGGGRCVARWNTKTGERTVVADRYEGKRLNAPNDLCIDRRGRIYFTDPRYAGAEPRELPNRAVYRIEADGRVVLVTREVEMPNGIVLGPDERTLYVGDHNNGGNRLSANDPEPKRGAMRLYAFPLDTNGTVHGQRRTLVDFGEENGCDGITVDDAGNLYVACRSLEQPGILVIDPQGMKLAFLPTGPAKQQGVFADWKGIPSNVEFGVGDDRHSLYVTIDQELHRIVCKRTGTPAAWERANRIMNVHVANSEQAVVGAGDLTFVADPRWHSMPDGWKLGEVTAVATDSHDRAFVFNRSNVHPVLVFDRDGRYLFSWGEGLFARPHGIHIDGDDAVYCTDDLDHTVRKFTTDGELLMTLGASGCPSDTGATSVDYREIRRAAGPFHFPTNVAIGRRGEIYVSDGYGNARIHKFSAAGELLLSWGAPGEGAGEFHVPHGIAVDRRGIVFVADRENSRIEKFDADGRFLEAWPDVARPCQVFIDDADRVYVAELGYRAGMFPGNRPPHANATGGRVSIFSTDGDLLARWGGGESPCAAGDFFAPHDIWVDSRGDLYVSEVTYTAGIARGAIGPDCHTLQKFSRTGRTT